MQLLVWSQLNETARIAALARPAARRDERLRAAVTAIIGDIGAEGWDALARHAVKIDRAMPRRLAVAPFAKEARRTLTGAQLDAIVLARGNVDRFHAAGLPAEETIETMPGLVVRKVWRPLDNVGLYIPGGAAPLFSTLLMLAIPARIAGVAEIVVATPPSPGGGLDPVVALAAEMCGIEAIWTMGGAQAIAALAFGAGDVPRVTKICGPGNAWVAEAKAQVAALPGGPAIDMPAGPSELMIIADTSANPRTVAADLLSQAEHDTDAQVILVATSANVADRVAAEILSQLVTLPRGIAAQASLASARSIVVETVDEAVGIANRYAPEHLSLAVADPAPLIDRIRNAGAIFAGHQAAETFGDYLAGSSHVLPTDGAARAWSGVSVHSFLKAMTVHQFTPEAARAAAAPAAALARLEGLEAHARAADARLETAA